MPCTPLSRLRLAEELVAECAESESAKKWHAVKLKYQDIPGADPENVEPGGANSINCQTEQGGATYMYFFVLHIRANRGACAGCAPSKSAPTYEIKFDNIIKMIN